MSLRDEVEEITGEFVTHTARAVLLDIDGQKEWFPFSQLSVASANQDWEALDPGDEVTILVPVWLLRKRGL